MAYPIPAHDPLPKTPLRPHLSRDDAQPLVRRVSVLTLHAHLEHFHRTGKNSVRGASHSARRRRLLQRELPEWRNDPFRDSVSGKEQRVDACDPDEGTGHPFFAVKAGKRWIGDEEGATRRTFVKCQHALFSHRLDQNVHRPFLRGKAGLDERPESIGKRALTNMPSITRRKESEVISLIHKDEG